MGVFAPVWVNRSFCSFRSMIIGRPSDLVAIEGRRMEQLLHAQPALGKPLRMMMMKEPVEYVMVGCRAVGPEVESHQIARGAQLLLHEGQCHLRGRGVGQSRERDVLCGGECLVQRH